jgi:hypothetical protein
MIMDPDDFPPERLERRLDFLRGRAEAHLEGPSRSDGAGQNMLSQACAATLYRDAACVALLLERPKEARALLHRSGSYFLKLGLPAGASLIALAGEYGAESELYEHKDVIEGVRQQWNPREAQERRKGQRPMADQARSEPRQLLAMMQADWLTEERLGSGASLDQIPLRLALRRSGGHPAGATGLTIDSYADTADWLAAPSSDAGYIPARIAISMATMMATRAEYLRAAQKDRFHWRMLARPAELVDLDATILIYLAMDHLGRPKANLEAIVDQKREDTPLLDAPVKIASALRRDQYSVA